MKDNSSKFTWVETYKEIVSYLKDKKNAQKSLINLLKEIGITGFKDEDKDGNAIELSEIDPFTFFCYLNKFGPKKRVQILQKLAKKLNFKNIPESDFGIPSANAQKLHLFPFKIYRINNEIDTLWELFLKALDDEIDDDLFGRALKIKSVGKTKLSEALFNINPNKYFPINGPTRPYLEENFGIDPEFDTFSEYESILEKIRLKIDKPFYEISYDAWKYKQSPDGWFNDLIKINCPPERIKHRKDWEKELHQLLNNKNGELNNEDWDLFFKLVNKDFWGGKVTFGRFGLSFTGNNKNKILSDIEKTNKWTQKIWSCSKRNVSTILTEFWEDNVPGAGIGFPTLILYLKDPLKYNIWLPKMEKGLKQLENTSYSKKDSESYLNYNSQLILIREKYNLEPQALDIVLSIEKDKYIETLEVGDPMQKIRYWLYAPGEGAKKWDEFYSKGIMAIGWNELGDLNQYNSKKEIADKLIESDPKGGTKKNDTITNFSFKETISVGDIVIAKKGKNDYLGYGIVDSDYFYDDSQEYYKKCRRVNWKKNGIWKEDGGPIVLKTLTDITKYPEYVDKLIKLIGIEAKTSSVQISIPLNTIIYGPPGTGKTYYLKNALFDKFTEKQSIQTKEEFCVELVQGISWWHVISIAMLDLKKAKVQEIYEHPLIQAKANISTTKTPKNTIWSLLQRHTKEDCPNVNFKKRDNPLFFEKDTQATWTIDEEITKVETPDFFDLLEKYSK